MNIHQHERANQAGQKLNGFYGSVSKSNKI